MVGKKMCGIRLTALGLALALAGGIAWGQPRDLTSYERIGKFQVLVDGRPAPEAKLFHSNRPPSFLILAPQVERAAVLLPARSQVAALDKEYVEESADYTARIRSGYDLEMLGVFRVEADQSVNFDFGGHRIGLRPKGYLLKEQSAGEIRAYDPTYARRAQAYAPESNWVEAIRQLGVDAKVTVYFGAWCQYCQQMVPRLMSLEKALEGSGIGFVYYGLPRDFSKDPSVRHLGLREVPTSVVRVGGREIGRISARDAKKPESALYQILKRHSQSG